MPFCKVYFAFYAEKHKKKFAYVGKKQYLCTGFENDQILRKTTNLFCTLNKQTNTLEKQASR